MGGYNFFNSNPFFTIFGVLDSPIGRIQFYLDTKNNGALPLDLACPKH
jgi:hypothetical protein